MTPAHNGGSTCSLVAEIATMVVVCVYAGRRNCKVSLDERRWNRPNQDCEPRQRG